MHTVYSHLCEPATFLKVTLLCFSRFINCTNGTKSRNASHTQPPKGSFTTLSNIYDQVSSEKT